jgi:fatty-acyl-CoA synthase
MIGRNGLTMGHILRYNALRQPNKTAILFQGVRYSWKEFNQRTNRLASALIDTGVKKGDVVSILSFNRNEYLELYFACGKIGAIMNALNFRLSPEEIHRAITHSESKIEIVDAFFANLYSQISSTLPSKGKPVPIVGGEPTIANGIPYEDFIKNRSENEPSIDVDPDDPVLLQYTSGTTGSPKGALLTHNNFIWDAFTYIYHTEISFNDVLVTASPFFHCSGLHILSDAAVLKGVTSIIIPFWNAEQVCETIQRERATVVFVMMPMIPSFLEALRSGKYDLSSLRAIGSSAAAYTSKLFTEILYRTGAKEMFFGYGLTEASPSVTLHQRTADVLQREGNSLGSPIFTVEVRTVNTDGKEVGKGDLGELILRGPQVFKGYLKDEEATRKTLREGWLYTGDLVTEDIDGNFWFKGRSKDMIKSGGENVFAAEIEQCILQTNPEVQEVVVYGKPDEKWGEAVTAAYILKPGEKLTGEELISRTRNAIAHYKAPKYAYVVDEFPRTGSGKVAKYKLIDLEPKG